MYAVKNPSKCPVCAQDLYPDSSFGTSIKIYSCKNNNHIFNYCVSKDKNSVISEELEIKLPQEKLLETKDLLGRGLRSIFPFSIKITNYFDSIGTTYIFRGLSSRFNGVLTFQEIFYFGLDYNYIMSHSKMFKLIDFDFSNLEETLQRAETYYMLARAIIN